MAKLTLDCLWYELGKPQLFFSFISLHHWQQTWSKKTIFKEWRVKDKESSFFTHTIKLCQFKWLNVYRYTAKTFDELSYIPLRNFYSGLVWSTKTHCYAIYHASMWQSKEKIELQHIHNYSHVLECAYCWVLAGAGLQKIVVTFSA